MLLPYNPSRRTAASLKRKKKVFSRRRRQKFTQNCMENRDIERKKKEDLEEKEKANLKNFHRRSYILIFALADFPLYKSLES